MDREPGEREFPKDVGRGRGEDEGGPFGPETLAAWIVHDPPADLEERVMSRMAESWTVVEVPRHRDAGAKRRLRVVSFVVPALVAATIVLVRMSANVRTEPPPEPPPPASRTPAVVATSPVREHEPIAPAAAPNDAGSPPTDAPRAKRALGPDDDDDDETVIVKGGLDRKAVRAVVRAHLDEVRSCYDDGLARDPNLAGRVDIQFTIGPQGAVPVSMVEKSSLADPEVGRCVARAVKRWRFPEPKGGGIVIVVYPFVLSR